VNLTAGGDPVTVKGGIGMLEGYAAQQYGAVPTLHAPRSVVPMMEDLEREADGSLTTIQGTKIANGGGYESNIGPDGNEAPAGQAWLYMTGEVVLYRTAIQSHEAPQYEVNLHKALAERVYVPTVECFIAAVLV